MRIFFDDDEEFEDFLRFEKIRRRPKSVPYLETKFNTYVQSQVPGTIHGIEDSKVGLNRDREKFKPAHRPGIVIAYPDYHNNFITTWVPLSSKTRRNTDIDYVFLLKNFDGIDRDAVVLLRFIRKYLCSTLVSFGQQIRNEKLAEIYNKLKRMGYEFRK